MRRLQWHSINSGNDYPHAMDLVEDFLVLTKAASCFVFLSNWAWCVCWQFCFTLQEIHRFKSLHYMQYVLQVSVTTLVQLFQVLRRRIPGRFLPRLDFITCMHEWYILDPWLHVIFWPYFFESTWVEIYVNWWICWIVGLSGIMPEHSGDGWIGRCGGKCFLGLLRTLEKYAISVKGVCSTNMVLSFCHVLA